MQLRSEKLDSLYFEEVPQFKDYLKLIVTIP
jgi:hypothetical protein